MVFSLMPDVYIKACANSSQQPPLRHTASILPLPLCAVYNVSLVIPFSSPEPPSAPQQLISVVNETSVVLEWAPPRRLGGRSDTSYSLECLICQTGSPSQNGGKALLGNRSISQPEAQHSGLGMQSDQGIVGSEVQSGRGVFQSRPVPGDYPRLSSEFSSQLCLPCGSDVLFSPSQTGLKTTRVVVSELRAHTHYTFIVHARNGVSQASGAGASQSVSVTVTTNQAGEKKIVINAFVRLLNAAATQNLLSVSGSAQCKLLFTACGPTEKQGPMSNLQNCGGML